jgi:hypothetical protein
MVKQRNEMGKKKTEKNGLLFIGTWGISGPLYGHSWLKLARIATTKVGTLYIYISK